MSPQPVSVEFTYLLCFRDIFPNADVKSIPHKTAQLFEGIHFLKRDAKGECLLAYGPFRSL